MAHRPITVDSAGADGSAEGVGGVEPGPTNDHGGDGAFFFLVYLVSVCLIVSWCILPLQIYSSQLLQ